MSIRLASWGAATTRMTGTIRDSIRHTLEGRLGYRFQSEALLVQALTHRSHGRQHNERLEFLGDSVLNCAVASLLYARLPTRPRALCPGCAPTSSSRIRCMTSPAGSHCLMR